MHSSRGIAAWTPAAAEANGAGSDGGIQIGVRRLSTTQASRGLEEFFPAGPANEHAEAGRAWKARDLRIKSNVELHQLWYVLLKERNMLLTVKQDSYRAQERFPAPDRIRKVRQSMKAIKVVLGERERAAAEAAEVDPEKWDKLRAEVAVDTGIRKQVGSEKKGRVARQPPNASHEVPEQSEVQYAQLLGVTRPGLAAPGQPQRPMTKVERSKFRRDLQEARSAVVAAKIQTIRAEVEGLDDDALSDLVEEAEDELLAGWEPEELSQRQLVALHEAYARGVTTFFEPRKIAEDRSVEGAARFKHGITQKKSRKVGKIPQKWAYAPVEPLDWQAYVKRRNVRVAAEEEADRKSVV